MTDVLILGGTGWLSARIAQRWLSDGADVVCLNRGTNRAPKGATIVRGDRDAPEVYDAVARRDWDHIVDVSSAAKHVERAVNALGARATRWTYVSSVSVYADEQTVAADETSARHRPARAVDAYDYAAQKVAAEDAVATLGERAFIVRPGLIVGPGDPSDRFGYWATAFARAGAEPVLLPPLEERRTQVIDVDDLAAFIVTATASGAVNAIGDGLPLAEMLGAIRDAAGHTGATIVAEDDWLRGQNVQYWAGPRSLPLWLPAEMTGLMTRSNAALHANGGFLRPVADTIQRVLADEQTRGLDRVRRAGLTRAEERALLDAR